MAVLIQKKITDYYCSASDFGSVFYHINRLWARTLLSFKTKVFHLMYYRVRHELRLANGTFPEGWHQYGENLPRCHVLHQETFRTIMMCRNYSIKDLQSMGYNTLSVAEIEEFDQCTAVEYLTNSFTPAEFVLAASEAVHVLHH